MSAIDHWDWIRIALGLALIGCNVGVWRGVALEESYDRFDKEIGKALLIRSLALEAFFAAALFVVDTTGSINQKKEVVSSKVEIAKLNEETQRLFTEAENAKAAIADANARAKEAELQLLKLKLPRTIWWQSFQKTMIGIPTATVEVLYVGEGCSDCFTVATSIMEWLGPNGLKWTIADFSPIEPRHAYPSLKGLPPAMSVLAQPEGITVIGGADVGEKLDLSDNSPVSGLIRAIIAGMAGPEGNEPANPNPLLVTGGLTTALPKGTVRVVVAPKL